jgi:NADPH-dependent curcumin reductase CurA
VVVAAVDPAMRGWLSRERNYLTVEDGAVMRAEAIGEIIESRNPEWHVGEVVYGVFGWQQYAAARPDDLYWRIDPGFAPAEVWLGTLGLNGLTAWIGLLQVGRPRPGETVLVSTAAGAVGSVVAGLARARGLRCIGITQGAAKLLRCRETLGCAHAIDYTGADLPGAIAAACPGGIDVFFDNTAGAIADAVFPVLNRGARVIQCGSVAVPTWLPVPSGPRRERDMIVKRLSWQGFVVLDHRDAFPEALGDLKRLFAAGMLDAETEILDGLEAAPGALHYLYSGHNRGRLCVRP